MAGALNRKIGSEPSDIELSASTFQRFKRVHKS
jgi:hypothetical protein